MKKKKKKKWFFIIGGVVIVLLFVVLALKSNNTKKTNVTVERAGRGEITSIVTATGKVKAQADVQISADVMGRIERLPVKEGDTVKTGQLLVEIDSRSREMDLAQARGALLSAQSALENAKINLDREKALIAKNLTSQAQVDLAQSTHDQAAAQVQIDQAVLDRAQDQLDKCTIRAPMSGIITQLNSEAGEMVVIGTMNAAGTVIMVISDLSTIEIEAEVDETDIASVNIGQGAKISLDAFPDTTFKGKVIEVGNSAKTSTTYGVASDQVTNFLVKVLIEDTVKNIKPGMTASVDITTAHRPDAIKIPSGAVVMRPEGTENEPLNPESENEGTAKAEEAKDVLPAKKKDIDGVFIVTGEQAKFVPVKTGIRDQQFVEIVNGVSEGDSVITGPYKTLRTIKQGEYVNPQKPKFIVAGDSVSVHID
jgi:HlyD family secretion protein